MVAGARVTGGRLMSATPDQAFHKILLQPHLVLFGALIKQRETKDESTTPRDKGETHWAGEKKQTDGGQVTEHRYLMGAGVIMRQ